MTNGDNNSHKDSVEGAKSANNQDDIQLPTKSQEISLAKNSTSLQQKIPVQKPAVSSASIIINSRPATEQVQKTDFKSILASKQITSLNSHNKPQVINTLTGNSTPPTLPKQIQPPTIHTSNNTIKSTETGNGALSYPKLNVVKTPSVEENRMVVDEEMKEAKEDVTPTPIPAPIPAQAPTQAPTQASKKSDQSGDMSIDSDTESDSSDDSSSDNDSDSDDDSDDEEKNRKRPHVVQTPKASNAARKVTLSSKVTPTKKVPISSSSNSTVSVSSLNNSEINSFKNKFKFQLTGS
ncbi:unnamed protein product [[Candida] boidinii]|nr:unnamed protein product [[Candida] boidinii]